MLKLLCFEKNGYAIVFGHPTGASGKLQTAGMRSLCARYVSLSDIQHSAYGFCKHTRKNTLPKVKLNCADVPVRKIDGRFLSLFIFKLYLSRNVER